MTFRIFILMTLILFAGCGDEYYGSGPDDPEPLTTVIESEPSLSPDGNYIYYISTDTTDSFYSGIFRISLDNLSRQKLVHGTGYHSPTVGSDNRTVAYLKDGRINYFSLANLSGRESPVTDTFYTIFYLRDTILIGGRNDSLFLITDSGEVSRMPIESGWDPCYIAEDRFVYFSGEASDFYAFRTTIFAIDPDSDTLLHLSMSARPHWPTLAENFDHIAFDIFDGAYRFIYTAPLGGNSPRFIAESEHIRPLYLNDGRLLFTGPNGRFYYSDYEGAPAVPLIPN